jgi:hypothetical protein
VGHRPACRDLFASRVVVADNCCGAPTFVIQAEIWVVAKTYARTYGYAGMVRSWVVHRCGDRGRAVRRGRRVNEHRISFGTGSATCQIALQARYCRVVQRHQAGFPELGLADQQAVARYVGGLQLQRFGDPQPGD